MTLEDAFALALRSHRSGNLPMAERIYRAILTAVPDHVDSLHFLGLLLHQGGASSLGVELIRRAVALRPDYVDALSNLGNVLCAMGRPAEAAEVWRRVVALAPHPQAYNNLGVLLKGEGRCEEAAAALRRAIDLDPGRGDAHFNLGNVLMLLGRADEARSEYRRAVELDPGFIGAQEALARTLVQSGRCEEAREVFEMLLAASPGNPIAHHVLAALTGRDVPDRASDEYVVQAFDSFAETFEHVLTTLGYRAPEVLSAAAAAVLEDRAGSLDVLDAGCGTGLCGPLLRPLARRLTGVDLSAEMLARAQARGLYDELVRAELTGYLGDHAGGFDLIVAADTLIYFGDLAPVLSAAAGALRGDGVLAFNLEDGGEAIGASGFRLQPNGRYEHGEEAVRHRLDEAGFGQVTIRRDALRREWDRMLTGLFVLARRT
jgi:predicted TPR repeat methyltransferase